MTFLTPFSNQFLKIIPPCTYNGADGVARFSRLFFGLILLLLSCNENIHEGLDDFEFSPDQATDYGVSCPLSV